jgi:L-threonylcarbamoyladenylate synthase
MNLKEQIQQAANLIRSGELVAFPTETVYGLGANALNPMAVAKIFEMKERPSFDPLIVHVALIGDIEQLTTGKDERVNKLASKFWPGPLTIVLPKSSIVPDIVTSGLPTVGIRMPNNPIALELIRQSQCPISAPSANKFGRVSPTTAQHVAKQLPCVKCILDGGRTQVGIESTIITLNPEGFQILRHGVITKAEIEKVVSFSPDPTQNHLILAPGMIKSHYSPNKPLYIIGESVPSNLTPERGGLISFSNACKRGFAETIILSAGGDLRECAMNLFETIHRMEELPVDYMLVEPIPETGIGIAIMDRLRKAACRFR